ncbi:MAG TPA: FG-GAP-like repeat-containing protein [Acidobacteriaceae bacterium]|nr:FG-GAP-like repeat-containing protein [Acidobacteriaceae bacterium]
MESLRKSPGGTSLTPEPSHDIAQLRSETGFLLDDKPVDRKAALFSSALNRWFGVRHWRRLGHPHVPLLFEVTHMSRFVARRFCSVSLAIAALAGIASLGNTAHAQGLFQPPNSQTTLPTGTTPLGVAAADFAQNGFQGLVVTDIASNSIKVYLANGPVSFQPAFTYPTCANPTAVIARDLNGDGYPDIAVACVDGVSIFLNDRTGNFGGGAALTYPAVNAVALAAGDFIGDGETDLAIASSTGILTVLLNNHGNISPHVFTVTGQLTGIVTADLNRDGHLDLAVSDALNNQVHVLLGDGTGNFMETGAYAVGTSPSGIVAADFNNDGNIDLATSNAGSNNVSILAGSPTATFTLASIQTAGTNPIGISVTDVNSDGRPDLIVYDAASSTNLGAQNAVAVLLGNGNGSLQPPQFTSLNAVPGTLAAVADFNRDGKPDLAITEQNSNQVTLLLNNTLPTPYPGGRNFSAPNTLSVGYGNMADGVAVGDFNHDGLQDIAVTYLEDNAVRVMLNNGSGPSSFSPATEYPVGKQPYFVAAADLNGDGYDDLVTVNTTDGTISVLMNNGKAGNGTFAPAQTYPVGRLPFQVAIGDLNGDGIPDLAVTNMGANTVSILFGGAGGTFTAGPTMATGTNPFGVAIGDFTHSGFPGIAVTCYSSSQLYVFPNNGNGTFGTPFIASTDSSPSSVVVGDFNRDGNLDIVTGNSIANDVSFFAGNGTGSFAAGVTSPALNFPVSLAAGDINGDGILDLVAVAPNYNQVSVTLGKGDGTFGTFQQRAEFAAGTQPWGLALADFNHDGQLDIVTANTFNRVNIASPAYQQMYMKEFPPTANGNPSIDVLSNASAVNVSDTMSPAGALPAINSGLTVTAYVQPALTGSTPTGSVIFEDINGNPLGAGPYSLGGGGSASYSTGPLGSGQYLFTTLYSGDTNFQPTTASGSAFAVTVAGTPVSLTLNPTIVTYGAAFTASVSLTGNATAGAPQGTVTLNGSPGNFSLAPITLMPNGTNATGNGAFMASAPNLNAGSYQFYGYFTPSNGAYQPGTSSEVTLTVAPEATTTSVTCTLSPSGCTATIALANGGSITDGSNVSFTVDGGSPTLVPINGNSATLPYDFSANYGRHTYTIVATFQPANPPANYVASQGTTTYSVHCTPHGCTVG